MEHRRSARDRSQTSAQDGFDAPPSGRTYIEAGELVGVRRPRRRPGAEACGSLVDSIGRNRILPKAAWIRSRDRSARS